MKIKKVTQSLILILITGCISCSSPNNISSDSNPSLYQKIGEKPAIDKIIDNLVNIIGQDKVIQYAFLDADYRNRAEPQDLLEHLK